MAKKFTSTANVRLVVVGAGRASTSRKEMNRARKNAHAHVVDLTAQLKKTRERLKRAERRLKAQARRMQPKQRVQLFDPGRGRVRLRAPRRRVRLQAPRRRAG